jgi:diphosphate-dependent phosphofructokinase
MMEDIYRNPGPLQFEGSGADTKPISLCVEDQDYMGRIKKLQEYLEKVLYLLNLLMIFAITKVIQCVG